MECCKRKVVQEYFLFLQSLECDFPGNHGKKAIVRIESATDLPYVDNVSTFDHFLIIHF